MVDGGRTVKAVAAELGIGRASLGQWVRIERVTRRGDWWRAQVEPAFAFLTEQGFELTDVEADNWWDIRANYRSDRVVVSVVYSIEFDCIEMKLFRRPAGPLPAKPVFITGSSQLSGYYGHDVVNLRRSDAKKVLRGQHGREPHEVAAQLAFWAEVLQAYGVSLDLLDELEIMVCGRVQRREDAVTVWVPRRATDEEEAATVALTRAALPDAASVEARRFPVPL